MSNIYWLISQKEPMSVAGPVGQMWVWITERGDIKASWHPEASGSTARFDVMFNEWSKLWTLSVFDSVRGLSDHIYEPKNSQIATSYNWRYFTQLFFFSAHWCFVCKYVRIWESDPLVLLSPNSMVLHFVIPMFSPLKHTAVACLGSKLQQLLRVKTEPRVERLMDSLLLHPKPPQRTLF